MPFKSSEERCANLIPWDQFNVNSKLVYKIILMR